MLSKQKQAPDFAQEAKKTYDSFTSSLARFGLPPGWLSSSELQKATVSAIKEARGGNTFSDGLACVSVPVPPEQRGEYGMPVRYLYIDTRGKPVIEKIFYATSRFSEGMAFVTYVEAGAQKTGFIDKTGKLVIDLTGKFAEARPFADGMALVQDQGKWGFIDATGKVIVAPKYHEFTDDFHEGLACVVLAAPNRIGYIDKTGREVIPLAEGSSSRYGMPGQVFTSHRGSFRHGLADHNGKIIDRTGQVVWPK